MPNADIGKTIEVFNRVFADYADMPCVTAWRSIGTHIFFEFGMPTLRPVRRKKAGGQAVLRGEISVHVSAYHWRMFSGSASIMNSDGVDDRQLAHVAKQYLRSIRPPTFDLASDGALAALFEREIRLMIWPNRPEDETDEDELSVALRDGWWGFNFEHGFYFSEPKDPA
jgi:hypothetical protein